MIDKQYGSLNIAVAIAASLYIIVILLHGYFGANTSCFSLWGCNAGFFGYDAFFEHFLCAFMGTLILVRVMKTYPHYSFLYNDFWKNSIVLISLALLFAVAWEFLEFGHDQMMTYAPPQRQIVFLVPDRRLQPNNTDTMGDLMFDFMGIVMALIVLNHLSNDLIKKV